MTNRRKAAPRPNPGSAAPQAAADDHHQEDLLDEALAETFPASDPVSTLSTGGDRRG